MGNIIDLNARRAQRGTCESPGDLHEGDADILVFTGVRYEEKKPEQNALISDQSRSGKVQ